MKKVLGFLAVAVMAVAVFAATKNVNQSGNMDLASLTSLNTANAECIGTYWLPTSCFASTGQGVCVFDIDGNDGCDPSY